MFQCCFAFLNKDIKSSRLSKFLSSLGGLDLSNQREKYIGIESMKEDCLLSDLYCLAYAAGMSIITHYAFPTTDGNPSSELQEHQKLLTDMRDLKDFMTVQKTHV